MIKSVTVTNYLGDSIKLELTRPEKSGFIIKSIDGLGPSPANVNTTEVSTNDGSLFNSARSSQRNIVLKLQFTETFTESIEDIRQKTYKYFPLKKNLTLLIETDNRIVSTVGYPETNEPTIFDAKGEGCSISIICPDPYFYSAGEDGINETVFYGVQAVFEFPFENNSLTEPLLEFGIIMNQTENVITYRGDSEIGLTISIHAIGEASNITIYNTGTREKMTIDTDRLKALTGSGIIAGDTITITTTKGQKRITLLRNGRITNILNCLKRGCNWFTLAKGDNIFAYSAETGSSNLQFRMENKIIYDGV